MPKIQIKSEKITPFGGIFPVMEAPDFITLLCHYIAHIENQSINSRYWVTQGDANVILTIFAPCLYVRKLTVLEPQAWWLLANLMGGSRKSRISEWRNQNMRQS